MNFTIPYDIHTIHSPSCYQFPTQSKKIVCTIAIDGEEIITAQGALDKIHHNQTQWGKYKLNISIYRSNSYQRTDIEEIRSIFD